MACHVGRASAGGLHSPSFAVGFCTGRPHADVLTVMTCHTIITMTDTANRCYWHNVIQFPIYIPLPTTDVFYTIWILFTTMFMYLL